MSYDIYCYHSNLGRPDLEEAEAVMESLEDFETTADRAHASPGIKQKIAKALIDYNPRLTSFDFDYEAIARLENTSIDEAKDRFDQIELNTPEDDPATQITILDNCVGIMVPYWYTGDKGQEVFNQVIAYTKIIRQVAGYFVYDPQTENVYDPQSHDFDGLLVYNEMSGQIADVKNEMENRTRKKPWWKFW